MIAGALKFGNPLLSHHAQRDTEFAHPSIHRGCLFSFPGFPNTTNYGGPAIGVPRRNSYPTINGHRKIWASVSRYLRSHQWYKYMSLSRSVKSFSLDSTTGALPVDLKEVNDQRRKMRKEETVTVDLLPRAVPAKHTDEGLRAPGGDNLIHPESVQKHLDSKFGHALGDVLKAMLDLAESLPPSELPGKAYTLCE